MDLVTPVAAVAENVTTTTAEVTTTVATSVAETTALTATGEEAADAVTEVAKLGSEEAFTRLSNADLEAVTAEEALGLEASPFHEMSEEEFAQKYPELAKNAIDSTSESSKIKSNGKIIAFNKEAADELAVDKDEDTEIQDSEIKEINADEKNREIDIKEGEEAAIKPLSLEQSLLVSDMPEEMKARIPDVLNVLKEYPELFNELADINDLDPKRRDKLVNKIIKVIHDEKDKKKKNLLTLLLAMFMILAVSLTEETGEEFHKAA